VDIKKIHQAIAFLRTIRLLNLADFFLYLKDRISNFRINRRFLTDNKNCCFPPPHLAFDAYGTTSIPHYFETGIRNAQLIANFINEYILTGTVKILDWGCGPGRIIRHIGKFLHHKSFNLYGSDYNKASIHWCQNKLPNICFTLNNLIPPFEYQSNFFDCVYALSVFTHLSKNMHFAWIKELRRILKPNGILIITTHGLTSSQNRLLNHEREKFDSGKLVVRSKIKEGSKWYLAYQPRMFMQNTLLKDFEILFLGEAAYYEQDIWVAKKTKEPITAALIL